MPTKITDDFWSLRLPGAYAVLAALERTGGASAIGLWRYSSLTQGLPAIRRIIRALVADGLLASVRMPIPTAAGAEALAAAGVGAFADADDEDEGDVDAFADGDDEDGGDA